MKRPHNIISSAYVIGSNLHLDFGGILFSPLSSVSWFSMCTVIIGTEQDS